MSERRAIYVAALDDPDSTEDWYCTVDGEPVEMDDPACEMHSEVGVREGEETHRV